MSTVAELLTNPELEAAILEAPLDPGPRMVYGDWLAAQGDPRGPWFALSAAVEASPLDVRLRSAATELFHADGPLFLGDGVRLRPNAWFGWLGGFLDEVRLHPFASLEHGDAAAMALFSHPHARFLRHVALGKLENLEEIVEALATEDLPLLESLTLIDGESLSAFEPIDIDRVLERPTIRALGARRVVWTAPVPHLRELHLLLLEDDSLERIGRTMKNLESLTIDFRVRQVMPIEIARLISKLPKLKTLRLLHPGSPDELVSALTPPPPSLTLLDVSQCTLGDGAQQIVHWPAHVGFRGIRTQVSAVTEERLKAGGRSVIVTRPGPTAGSLRGDTGEDTWWVHRAKTEGRDALRIVPDGGRELFESAIRNLGSNEYDIDAIEACVTLPSERWHVWPWASAASARSWKKQYALSEAIAREGLMREPREPNFYAFVIYALRRQQLMTEAVAEVARAEAALKDPPRVAQYTGAPLCLIDCMYTLAQAGDYAAALALADRLSKLNDQNLQAMRAMCHAAAGDVDAARAAIARAGDLTGAVEYVTEPARRAVYEHALAVCALLPPTPDVDAAIQHLETVWPVYPERNWFKTDPNLAAVHEDPRFLAMLAK